MRGGGLPEGQKNSREAENTDDAKEHRGAKHKDVCLGRDGGEGVGGVEEGEQVQMM